MIIEKFITIDNTKIYYLESGKTGDKEIILLHGMKFNSSTWVETGTLALLTKIGFHTIAVDLPGFGKSNALDRGKPETLKAIIKELGLLKPVIISPSMSGGYSLPVIADGEIQLSAYVAVAPTNIPNNAEALKGNNLPTLAIWGSNDEIVPPENADILCNAMTNTKKAIIENGGHPTYLIETKTFHKHLIEFLESIEVAQ